MILQVIGFGLAIVGTFPSGMAIFVLWYTIGAPPEIPSVKPEVSAGVYLADIVFHQLLLIGTFIGVITLPLYTILLGSRLVRKKIEMVCFTCALFILGES